MVDIVAGKAAKFCALALSVPIKAQNSRDFLSGLSK